MTPQSKSKLRFTTDTLIRSTTDSLIEYLKRFKKQLITAEVLSEEDWSNQLKSLQGLTQVMQRVGKKPDFTKLSEESSK